jgi:membrane fusion protein (multidrug efflux system)
VDGGLVAGDRVIVEGLQKVQPGMPVQATEAAAAPAGAAVAPATSGTGAPATGATATDSPATGPQK